MSKKILLVDDERRATEMMDAALSSLGYEVRRADCAEQALLLAEKEPVDLLVSDIRMPGMAGTELFCRLKRIDPFVQAVIITGYPSLQDIAQMLEAGANDFLIKPFPLERLEQVVSEAFGRLERWKALRGEWLARRKTGRKRRG